MWMTIKRWNIGTHINVRTGIPGDPKTVLKNVVFGLIISSNLKMSRKRRVGAWKVSEDKRFVMVIVAVLGDRFEEGGVGLVGSMS